MSQLLCENGFHEHCENATCNEVKSGEVEIARYVLSKLRPNRVVGADVPPTGDLQRMTEGATSQSVSQGAIIQAALQLGLSVKPFGTGADIGVDDGDYWRFMDKYVFENGPGKRVKFRLPKSLVYQTGKIGS